MPQRAAYGDPPVWAEHEHLAQEVCKLVQLLPVRRHARLGLQLLEEVPRRLWVAHRGPGGLPRHRIRLQQVKCRVHVVVEVPLHESSPLQHLLGEPALQVHHQLQHVVVAVAWEGDLAGEELVHHAPERPHVHGVTVRQAQDYLRSPVEPGHEVGGELVVAGVHCTPQVAQLHLGPARVHQHVVRLDVRVQYSARPQQPERLQQLVRVRPHRLEVDADLPAELLYDLPQVEVQSLEAHAHVAPVLEMLHEVDAVALALRVRALELPQDVDLLLRGLPHHLVVAHDLDGKFGSVLPPSNLPRPQHGTEHALAAVGVHLVAPHRAPQHLAHAKVVVPLGVVPVVRQALAPNARGLRVMVAGRAALRHVPGAIVEPRVLLGEHVVPTVVGGEHVVMVMVRIPRGRGLGLSQVAGLRESSRAGVRLGGGGCRRGFEARRRRRRPGPRLRDLKLLPPVVPLQDGRPLPPPPLDQVSLPPLPLLGPEQQVLRRMVRTLRGHLPILPLVPRGRPRSRSRAIKPHGADSLSLLSSAFSTSRGSIANISKWENVFFVGLVDRWMSGFALSCKKSNVSRSNADRRHTLD